MTSPQSHWLFAALLRTWSKATLEHAIQICGPITQIHEWESALVQSAVTPIQYLEYMHTRRSFDYDTSMHHLERHGITLLSCDDHDFPKQLNTIPQAPYALFVRGNKDLLLASRMLAVVGSRTMTEYGHLCCEKIIPPLVERGVVIVSGLALGIDAVAHEVALASGGAVCAVLAGGLDDASLSPRSNASLGREIIAHGGVLVSEFPMGTPSESYHFPYRNRIISGLSQGVVVIQAALASGTMHTVRAALEQGREVFAVPGEITHRLAAGPNSLIAQGAHLVASASDIADIFHWEVVSSAKGAPIVVQKEEHKIICDLLLQNPLPYDTLVEKTGYEPSYMMTLLMELELMGLVQKLQGQRYIHT